MRKLKTILNIIGIVSILAVAVFSYCVLSGHTVVARNSAESADLTADQLDTLKYRAIDQGDRNAAAKIYWYYRLTKKDYTETKKWKYAVESYLGEDDGLPK